MDEPFVGEIRLFAGDFAPRGYALCNGQLLSISQNTTLFAILGVNYGGNGTTNFALPDLQGRAPLHAEQGAGLSPYSVGQSGGETAVSLTINEMPLHTHSGSGTIQAQSARGTSASPVGNVPAASSLRDAQYAATGDTTMSANAASLSINPAGGSQAHNNMQPYLAVTYIIALQGIFPARH